MFAKTLNGKGLAKELVGVTAKSSGILGNRSGATGAGLNGASPGRGRGLIHFGRCAAPSAAADRFYLLIGRKPPGSLFRESEPAINGNLKHPADPGHQLDIGAVFLFQPIPRTEGTRFIVSRLAPLDSDFHACSSRKGLGAFDPLQPITAATRVPQPALTCRISINGCAMESPSARASRGR
jgi:hypothetical protein